MLFYTGTILGLRPTWHPPSSLFRLPRTLIFPSRLSSRRLLRTAKRSQFSDSDNGKRNRPALSSAGPDRGDETSLRGGLRSDIYEGRAPPPLARGTTRNPAITAELLSRYIEGWSINRFGEKGRRWCSRQGSAREFESNGIPAPSAGRRFQ